MSVTAVGIDESALTMTVSAEFAAPVERVWQVWADPRQLELWWGPPTYPATVEQHDLSPGGSVTYFMTGPEGDRPRGRWLVEAVQAPNRLEFNDGFADEAGNPNPDMPTLRVVVDLAEISDAGTCMTVTTTFPSAEALDELRKMGMEEGMTLAVSQIDGLLAN